MGVVEEPVSGMKGSNANCSADPLAGKRQKSQKLYEEFEQAKAEIMKDRGAIEVSP